MSDTATKDLTPEQIAQSGVVRRERFLELVSSNGMTDELELYMLEKTPALKSTTLELGNNVEVVITEQNVTDKIDSDSVVTTLGIGNMRYEVVDGKRKSRIVIETDGDIVTIVEDTTTGLLEATKMLETVLRKAGV